MPPDLPPIPDAIAAGAVTMYVTTFDPPGADARPTRHASLDGARAVAAAWLRVQCGDEFPWEVTRPWDGHREDWAEVSARGWPARVTISADTLYP